MDEYAAIFWLLINEKEHVVGVLDSIMGRKNLLLPEEERNGPMEMSTVPTYALGHHEQNRS